MHRQKISTVSGLALLALVVALAAGCGGGGKKASTTTTTSSSAIQAPANIKSAGKLVFCERVDDVIAEALELKVESTPMTAAA